MVNGKGNPATSEDWERGGKGDEGSASLIILDWGGRVGHDGKNTHTKSVKSVKKKSKKSHKLSEETAETRREILLSGKMT